MQKQPTPIDNFKTAILTAAADAVMKEMTPEKMREFAEEIIKQCLTDLTSSPYNSLGQQIRQVAEKVLADYLKTKTVLTLVQKAVEEGVAEALSTLRADTRGKVVQTCLDAVGSAIANPSARR